MINYQNEPKWDFVPFSEWYKNLVEKNLIKTNKKKFILENYPLSKHEKLNKEKNPELNANDLNGLVLSYWQFLDNQYASFKNEALEQGRADAQEAIQDWYDSNKPKISQKIIDETANNWMMGEGEILGKYNVDIINFHSRILGDDKYYTNLEENISNNKNHWKGKTWVRSSEWDSKPGRKYEISNAQNWWEYNLLIDWALDNYEKSFVKEFSKLMEEK